MTGESDRLRAVLGAQSRMRGLMLGLALGETLGAAGGGLPAKGPLRAGVSTQLACFTAEGILRGLVRWSHKGICHPPTVVLHAYCRWAVLQGIEAEKMRRRWSANGVAWPDGWLASVPVLAERRGSAPATVAALSRIDEGQERMATASRGCHALTRTLPLAITGAYGIGQAAAFAALTHGDEAARSATAHAVLLAHHCLTDALPVGDAAGAPGSAAGSDVGGAVGGDPGTSPMSGLGTSSGSDLVSGLGDDALGPGPSVLRALRRGIGPIPAADPRSTHGRHGLSEVLRSALDRPADVRRLARLAPDATAPAALRGGLYAAASFPGREQLLAAMEFAATAPDGASVACVTGALLGAVHGADALPVDLVSRHELSWVLDTLARDLQTEIVDSPGGGEYEPGWDDPNWWHRYPGW